MVRSHSSNRYDILYHKMWMSHFKDIKFQRLALSPSSDEIRLVQLSALDTNNHFR
jgi:hypothetical protein